MLGPVPGVKSRRYIKIHVIKPDIVVLKIWKQDIVKQKKMQLVDHRSQAKLILKRFAIFFVGEEL